MDEIKISDFKRILFGEAPAEFLIEVLIRTIIIYICLQLILRFMGKRMTGQLSISEMSVMITLGAIIAGPMQLPDRGIFHGLIALICVAALQRAINYLGMKSVKAEHLLQGEESILVKNGVLQLAEMRRSRVSRQQLFAALRNKKIYNLGEVERVYLEACGLMSIYRFDTPLLGLSVTPPKDDAIESGRKESSDRHMACTVCGCVTNHHDRQSANCPSCKSLDWSPAVH